MLKTRVYFKYISGTLKGKRGKLSFRKSKSRLAGFVSYYDGTNKRTYKVSFGRYRPRKRKLSKEIKQRIISAMREVTLPLWNKYIKKSAKKIQRKNYIVYGQHYRKSPAGLQNWFEQKYKSEHTGEIVDEMFYDNNIKDTEHNYVEVKRTIVKTEKNVTTYIYKFETGPDNHPSFVLQNTDINDFDNPEMYKAVYVTYSITFRGVGGKEYTLPEKIYTFDYFKELYNVQNKWLLEVNHLGKKENFYTLTGLILGKIRDDMSNMGWSMSGAFYQLNPKKPLQTSDKYSINITVQAVHDTTGGKFARKHRKHIADIVKLDRVQRDAFKRDVPEKIFTSDRISYYNNLGRKDLWKYYISGKEVTVKIGKKNYTVKPYSAKTKGVIHVGKKGKKAGRRRR